MTRLPVSVIAPTDTKLFVNVGTYLTFVKFIEPTGV